MELTVITPSRRPGRRRWLACAVIVLIAAAASPSTAADPSAPPPSRPLPASDQVTALWRDLGANLAPTLTASRGLLLGSRDPNGPSCVRPEDPRKLAFAESGGPGTRLAHQWYTSRSARRSAAADFAWQQTTLRALLDGLGRQNAQVLPQAIRLADTAERLARTLREGSAMPETLAASPAAQHTWPGYCAASLVAAMEGGNLGAARQWADELASATFALADLHRWLEYLVRNHLTALDFQARYPSLYQSCNVAYSDQFIFQPVLSCLPGGQASRPALRNLIEVEHQAERLFRLPAGEVVRRLDGTSEPLDGGVGAAPATVRMPPHLRSAFLRLRGCLSPAAQALWDRAARSPFDRSYLSNMLHRTATAGVLDPLAVVLTRYDRANPKPTQHGLMDVIFYRGGDPEGGNDWAERFDARLMDAAATLGGSDEQAILGAQHFARALLGAPDHYGAAYTLREALDTTKFDCINGTNVIGCLYRNAGRAGFYSIRWSGGAVGHTVAAAEVARPDGPAIVIVDALEDAQVVPGLWPQAYQGAHRWPPAYPGAKADVHTVELYTRGLDNYVWVEGYVMRGPDAGLLVRAAVPYLPNRQASGMVRVRRSPAAALAPPKKG